MADSNQPKKYSVEEIRKTHPRMGMKWDKEEDERLQQAYTEWRSSGAGDFELFISKLVKDFARAAGGLKARLAMHFPDVPGWDYSREQYRAEELQKRLNNMFIPEKDAVLKHEYEKYEERQTETYIRFINRMSELLGVQEKDLVRTRLAQVVSEVQKFTREDVRPAWNRSRKREPEPPPVVDFSGNTESQEALRVMSETKENLFLTGEAGTGKSTLLQYFRRTTEKNVAVLAPTGVAALNVEGQTIHSFCGFGPDITLSKVKKLAPFAPKKKLLMNLHAIIIDEISMVRADLLDCVDKFLRINGPNSGLPFGGIQMIFIGDLFQLPPVDKDFPFSPPPPLGEGRERVQGRSVPIHRPLLEQPINGHVTNSGNIDQLYASPYFFDSKAFKNSRFLHIQLRQIYRQQEQVFIELLNAVRNNIVSEDHLRLLNQRAATEDDRFTFEQFAIYLTPTNARARQVNNFFLQRLSSPLKIYQGKATGNFENRELPTDLDLQVKIGAQVMMLNNDRRKRWVNGTMGKVVGIKANNNDNNDSNSRGVMPDYDPASIIYENEDDEYGDSYLDREDEQSSSSDTIIVELETGETVYVEPHTWEMFKFVLDKNTQSVDSEVTGTYTQYPFKLAWAVTIHKSQGKSFNKVYIDLSTGTFAHGQLYVALSRCRALGGLYLKRPISRDDVILDNRVVQFLNSLPKIK